MAISLFMLFVRPGQTLLVARRESDRQEGAERDAGEGRKNNGTVST